MDRRLFRSQTNRVLLGVCGGFGDYFNLDPVIIRVVWILISLATGVFPGIIAYFIIALVIPLQGSSASSPRDNIREAVTDIKDTATTIRDEVKTTFGSKDASASAAKPPLAASPVRPANNTTVIYVVGIVIIAIGFVVFLVNVITHPWAILWAGVLILAGLAILLLAWKKPRV